MSCNMFCLLFSHTTELGSDAVTSRSTSLASGLRPLAGFFLRANELSEIAAVDLIRRPKEERNETRELHNRKRLVGVFGTGGARRQYFYLGHRSQGPKDLRHRSRTSAEAQKQQHAECHRQPIEGGAGSSRREAARRSGEHRRERRSQDRVHC